MFSLPSFQHYVCFLNQYRMNSQQFENYEFSTVLHPWLEIWSWTSIFNTLLPDKRTIIGYGKLEIVVDYYMLCLRRLQFNQLIVVRKGNRSLILNQNLEKRLLS